MSGEKKRKTLPQRTVHPTRTRLRKSRKYWHSTRSYVTYLCMSSFPGIPPHDLDIKRSGAESRCGSEYSLACSGGGGLNIIVADCVRRSEGDVVRESFLACAQEVCPQVEGDGKRLIFRCSRKMSMSILCFPVENEQKLL